MPQMWWRSDKTDFQRRLQPEGWRLACGRIWQQKKRRSTPLQVRWRLRRLSIRHGLVHISRIQCSPPFTDLLNPPNTGDFLCPFPIGKRFTNNPALLIILKKRFPAGSRKTQSKIKTLSKPTTFRIGERFTICL